VSKHKTSAGAYAAASTSSVYKLDGYIQSSCIYLFIGLLSQLAIVALSYGGLSPGMIELQLEQ